MAGTFGCARHYTRTFYEASCMDGPMPWTAARGLLEECVLKEAVTGWMEDFATQIATQIDYTQQDHDVDDMDGVHGLSRND